MVISDTHRFVFINLPQTASTAIQKELIDQYDAREFLFKHALYRTDYLKGASAAQQKYRTISGLRDPMDITVSTYFKVKSDHENRYTDAKANKIKHGFLRKHIMFWWNKRSYKDIVGSELTFSDWFMKNHRIPYASWSILDHKHFTKVIRYENLQEDFADALRVMGIPQKRPLPIGNKTAIKSKHFTAYFDTAASRSRAKFVFGPYMAEWGYTFPAEWDNIKIPRSSFMLYRLINLGRKFFWSHLR
ncbi:MAG: sulfotransferase family 2 domain-containing protein [Flavobacteriales bacterium]